MKIIYVYYTDHDQHSAHSNQIIHTCNAIHDAGYEITVVTAGGLEAYADEHGLQISFGLHDAFVTGVHPLTDQTLYYLEAIRAARHGDVLFTRDISFLRVLKYVPRRFTPPTVFEAHKCYVVAENMGREEERRRLRRTDRVITISDGIRSDIEQLGASVDSVVWDAANANSVPEATPESLRAELGIDPDSVVFVYAGSLDSRKYDLQTVLDAFASIESSQPTQLYVLGGTQSNVDQLEQYADSLGLDDSVQFTGHVPQQLVFKYLKAADVGIVAQRPTDICASKYTSPLKLFEYLVCELLVVATDVPSIREVSDTEPRILTYEGDNATHLRGVLKSAIERSDSSQTDSNTDQYNYSHRAKQLLPVLQVAVEE